MPRNEFRGVAHKEARLKIKMVNIFAFTICSSGNFKFFFKIHINKFCFEF